MRCPARLGPGSIVSPVASARCLSPADAPLQEDYPGAAVNSGVIACMPNHPAWKHAFDLMVERKGGDSCLGSVEAAFPLHLSVASEGPTAKPWGRW